MLEKLSYYSFDQIIRQYIPENIKIQGVRINPSSHVKYLGIFIDEHLSWKHHIKELSNKLSGANCIISKLHHHAPKSAVLSVYYALFYSHMVYASSVWSLTSKGNIELSVISKVYEKLIFTRIFAYLDKKDLIYSKQFGFRSGYSTNHALLSITERIRTLMDSGHYVGGIFIDLEKAFDTVNHNILCEKLNYYGLRGNVNKLIQSYLWNRWQYVSINGFDSDCRNLWCTTRFITGSTFIPCIH